MDEPLLGANGDTPALTPAAPGSWISGGVAHVLALARNRLFSSSGVYWREWMTPVVIKQLPHPVQDMISVDERTTMFNFAGPALKAICPSGFIYWPFAILFPFVVCWCSSCPEGEHPFAHYPSAFWFPVLIVVSISMWMEWKGLSWILYTLAHYLAPFKIFFGFRVQMNTWLMMVFGMSFVNHLDIATNGLFLAKILKTLSHCDRPATETMQRIWDSVINESIVRNVPGFKNLSTIMLMSWSSMLLQPVFCFLCAYPIKGVRNINYQPHLPEVLAAGSFDENAGEPCGYRTLMQWLSCSEDRVWHADTLQLVATVNRMVSITDKSMQWWLVRGQEFLKRQTAAGYIRAYQNLDKLITFNLTRLMLVQLLEKSLMLEAQGTIFAISRCLIPHDSASRYDGQMLASLLVSFLTFLKVLYDMVDQHRMMYHFWKQAHEQDGVPLSELFKPQCTASDDPERAELRHTKRSMLCKWLWFFMTFFFLLGFFVHCVAKFVMTFVCEDSLWNIPLSHKPHTDLMGCVDVSRFLVDVRS